MARKPKQRQRQSRMHAAIDAMKILGYDAKVVEAKCNQLLKEYGGTENWPFIESDAYLVLIESLIDEQKGKETEAIEAPLGENLLEANEEGRQPAILLIEGSGSDGNDLGPSKLLLMPVSPDISESVGSHTIRTGDNPKAETNQGKQLGSTSITSRAPKVSKLRQPKPENLNGWLIE